MFFFVKGGGGRKCVGMCGYMVWWGKGTDTQTQTDTDRHRHTHTPTPTQTRLATHRPGMSESWPEASASATRRTKAAKAAPDSGCPPRQRLGSSYMCVGVGMIGGCRF